MYTADITYHT